MEGCRVDDVAKKREIIDGMAEALEARRIALNMNVEALCDASGVTRQGLRPLLAGERRAYQERLTMPVCRALQWTPDSIARLMRGEQAAPVSQLGGGDPSTGQHQLTVLVDKVDELVGRFDQLQELVERALDTADATSKRRAAQRARQSTGGPQ